MTKEERPMSAPVEVLVAVFNERYRAESVVDTLKQMNKSGAIKLVDAAVITRNEEGKVKIDEVEELTTLKGGERGAIVGGVLGLIFPPSLLASAALGGIAGALLGKLRDTGIKTDELKQIADELEPNQTAVIALVEDVWAQKFMDAATGYDRLFRQALDAEAAAVLAADPETGDVVAAGFVKTDAEGAPAAAPAATATTSAAGAPPAPEATAPAASTPDTKASTGSSS
jgi:uncharacterized membrane protein